MHHRSQFYSRIKVSVKNPDLNPDPNPDSPIHIFLGLLDPDPNLLVTGMDPGMDPDPAPDPSIIKQN